MEKLNQLFKRLIGEMLLLGEISDPRVHFVTITFADVSKDLSVAHIGFSVLSDDPRSIKEAQDGLDSAHGRVRRLIGERVTIRRIPEIKFVYDDTISKSVSMSRTLEDIRREREAQEGKPSENDEKG
jgi:ribosome-binding factor A